MALRHGSQSWEELVVLFQARCRPDVGGVWHMVERAWGRQGENALTQPSTYTGGSGT